MIPGISKSEQDEIETYQDCGNGGQHENDLQASAFSPGLFIIIDRIVGIPVFPGKQASQAFLRFFVFLVFLFSHIAVIGSFFIVFICFI